MNTPGQNKGEMPVAEVVRLADLVNYQEGSVVSRTIVKRRGTSAGGRSGNYGFRQGAADYGRRSGSDAGKPTSLFEGPQQIQDAVDDDPFVNDADKRSQSIHRQGRRTRQAVAPWNRVRI